MLRIIGGIYRSRRIKEVKSKKTRPTTDKNKEAVFNMLGQYFSGGKMLDLYAGSGSIGIEAISRGVEEVDFVDNFSLACKTIKENIELLDITDKASIIKKQSISFLKSVDKSYDYIFADPPYALNHYQEILEIIVSRQLLNDNGIIIFEADRNIKLPEKFNNCNKYKEKTFGITKFAFYRLEKN
ncbi:MAG: 16S rRNA (guanine(966)-N(2))-methyltransferase RsmD [Tenericutes bacterium 4572_104]|nr:MAG: 16S rRNA (guanine(966)-N(2))-methyltransferase RsmD [Tenericutes bacterium 4572_104]